jgi:hypothetical protein
VWFDKRAGLWLLHDALQPMEQATNGGDGKNAAPSDSAEPETEVTLWFHFAPMPVRLDRTNNAVRSENPTGPNLAVMPLGEFPLAAEIETGWVSPRYGIKEEAPVAKFKGRVKLPADLVVLLYPHESPMNLATVRTAGRLALEKMRETLTLSLTANRSRPRN